MFNSGGDSKTIQKYTTTGFTCSPADISIIRQVDFQDEDISEEIWDKLCDLCYKYPQIFSSNSEDFGHTDVVTVDKDTEDSLCQSYKDDMIYLWNMQLRFRKN